MDFTFCPECDQLVEAGGDSYCTCNEDDGYGDWLYDQMKDRQLDEELREMEG